MRHGPNKAAGSAGWPPCIAANLYIFNNMTTGFQPSSTQYRHFVTRLIKMSHCAAVAGRIHFHFLVDAQRHVVYFTSVQQNNVVAFWERIWGVWFRMGWDGSSPGCVPSYHVPVHNLWSLLLLSFWNIYAVQRAWTFRSCLLFCMTESPALVYLFNFTVAVLMIKIFPWFILPLDLRIRRWSKVFLAGLF